MAKNLILSRLLFPAALCLCALFSSSFLTRDAEWSPGEEPQIVEDTRSRILTIARAEIGVQERTGRNDGDRIAGYLRYTRLGEGHEWCAAFVSWCFGQAGFAEPRTPWSPALFPQRRRLSQIEGAQAGDVVGFWVREKGRIGHAGLVEMGLRFGAMRGKVLELGRGPDFAGSSDSYLITIEGNKANAVRRVRRHLSTIHAAADWVSGQAVEVEAKAEKGGRR